MKRLCASILFVSFLGTHTALALTMAAESRDSAQQAHQRICLLAHPDQCPYQAASPQEEAKERKHCTIKPAPCHRDLAISLLQRDLKYLDQHFTWDLPVVHIDHVPFHSTRVPLRISYLAPPEEPPRSI